MDELLKKSGAKDKFALVRIAIKKTKQLIQEKDKNVLFKSEKLSVLALKEIQKREEQPQ